VIGKDISEPLELEDECEVFIYTLADGSLEATAQIPKLQLHEFASLTVKGAHQHGYFFDWGLTHDLYAPDGQVHNKLDLGRQYIVRLVQDKLGKLVATTKIERFLEDQCFSLHNNTPVDILIYAETPLGYKAVVNKQFMGLLYKSELIDKVKIGDQRQAYIKFVRKDGKLDLSLQLHNERSRKLLTEEILDDLRAHGGISSLTDKSTPDEIFTRFKVSKGAYKKAIGNLFKSKKIRIEPNGIFLIEK